MVVNTYGVDVSNWQRPPLPSLYTSFIFAKATEGHRYNDPAYKTWRNLARTKGKTFGAYHFARPDNGNSAVAEAAHFLATAQLRPGDLAVLDIEVIAGNLATWVEDWCRFVETHANADVIIYTNSNVGQHLENSGHRPLWIADPSHPAGEPSVPYPWHHWTIHQFGSQQGFDRDITNGMSGSALQQFGCHAINSHKAPAVKAADQSRGALIAMRNQLARLFWLAHIPWGATA